MNRRRLFQALRNPEVLPSEQLTSLALGSVPAAIAAYVTAAHSAGPTGNLTILTCTALPLTLVDNGANGSGSVELYDFPQAYVRVESVLPNLALGIPLADATNFVASVGSAAAAADGTLTSTEADLVASTAVTVASAAGAFKAAPLASVQYDGHVTPVKMYLNAASSADPVGNKTVTFTGTITIRWSNLGTY